MNTIKSNKNKAQAKVKAWLKRNKANVSMFRYGYITIKQTPIAGKQLSNKQIDKLNKKWNELYYGYVQCYMLDGEKTQTEAENEISDKLKGWFRSL